MKNLLPWIAAMAGGVFYFLGYAGFDMFCLEWICLVPILWAICDQSPGRAFLIGWVAGIVTHCGGFYWVALMFRHFAGAPWPLAAAGLLLMATVNSIGVAVWAWGTRLVCRDAGWNVAWVSPVIWIAVEKFWPEIFPNYLGASQYRFSLMTQIADVTGILGVTFVVVYANSSIYATIEQRRAGVTSWWRPAAVFCLVLAALLGYGAFRLNAVDKLAAAGEKMTVGVIQANLGAGEKQSDPEFFVREHREMTKELIAARPVDLVIWPESILSAELASRGGEVPTDLLGGMQTPTLFGAVLRISEGNERRIYNSAVLVNGSGRILGTYDKMVLVPFGEYIPFGDSFPVLYSWSPYSSRFWSGENREPFLFNGHPLSVSICYEDIFPGQVRMLMHGGRERRIPDALFNLTNDSWYGNTIEPTEHLALASFRAIEHRRALVRATNTGISAIVDPAGRIDRRSGQWTRETLVGRIPLLQGRTLYAMLGDWIGWVCLLITLAGLGRAYRVTRLRAG
jgi:apolipoprotein N-acyltransferase